MFNSIVTYYASFQQLTQQQNLVLPTNTDGTNIALGQAVQEDMETKQEDNEATSTQDVSVDPLTADDEDNEDVLHYEVTAN